jgi:hypothetical protein
MHDYDVGAVSLSSPPASAVIQPYRPAVLVKNLGVHDALAVGSLRIYSPAGLLIFTTEIYSGVIAPGETKPALAVNYWTPPAIGRYQVIGYVSCINDQNEPNNSLQPCFVEVIPGEPPEPSTVPLHAAQHEEGMSDELNVDGLHGRLTDAQTPTGHKATHQAAGSDALDVTGLPGILADGQPIADHHESHEDGGGDEMNVDNLHGELYNLQKTKIHGNEKHDPNFASSTDLSNHLADTTAVHAVATNLEQTANKGAASGYAGLDAQAHVPDKQLATVPQGGNSALALTLGSGWSYALPTIHAQDHQVDGTDELDVDGLSGELADPQTPKGHHVSHEPGGDDPVSIPVDVAAAFSSEAGALLSVHHDSGETVIASLTVPAAHIHSLFSAIFDIHGSIGSAAAANQDLTLRLKDDNGTLLAFLYPLTSGLVYDFLLHAHIHAIDTAHKSATMTWLLEPFRLPVVTYINHAPTAFDMNPTTTHLTITAEFTNSILGTHLVRRGFFAQTTTPQPTP